MSLLAGTIWCESEFQYDGSTLLTGSCGPNALAMALSWAHQSYVSTVSVYRYMRGKNLCAVGGASNVGEIDVAAQALGTPVAFRAYAEPWLGTNALNWINTQIDNGHAVILNVANGQVLLDARTGKGENARNLRYHFLTIIGRDTLGYNVLDGDNLTAPWNASTSVSQYYTLLTILRANPCGAVALASEETQGAAMHIPPGWKDQNAVLSAPNNIPILGALRAYVLAYPTGWDSDDWPLEVAHDTGDGRVVQTFQFSQLRVTKATDVVQRGNIGADLLRLQKQVADDAAAKASLQQDLAGMQKTISDLQAKLAQTNSTAAQAAIAALAAALREV